MGFEEVEVTWIASALFFGLGQAAIAVIFACIPDNIDRAIEYLEWIAFPINILVKLSFLALFSAIIINWFYFNQQAGGWWRIGRIGLGGEQNAILG